MSDDSEISVDGPSDESNDATTSNVAAESEGVGVTDPAAAESTPTVENFESRVLDIAALVNPISASSPTGEDLVTSADYARLMATYQATQEWTVEALERRQRGDGAPQKSDNVESWPALLDGLSSAIANQSKDLKLLRYLIVAASESAGFEGFRDGLRLAINLVQRYGDKLHPQRKYLKEVRSVVSMNVVEALQTAPLTKLGERSYFDWILARHIGKHANDQVDKLIASGVVSVDQFKSDLRDSPVEFVSELKEMLDDCLDMIDSYKSLASELVADPNEQFLSCQQIKELINDCRNLLIEELSHRQPEDTSDSSEATAANRTGNSGNIGTGGVVANREQALDRLAEIASFFATTQPHSPISLHLKRAVKWGKMSLPDLLNDITQEELERFRQLSSNDEG